jgi:hypothetical protein
MKPWKLLIAVALAVGAVFLLSSMVIAAPAPMGVAPVNRMYDDPDPIVTGTVPMTHPVGNAIALYLNIPYTQVMALHEAGLGFGVIARAYLTALASGGTLTPTQLLDMHQAGVGWGQIKKEYGVHPGGNGLGTIMGNKQVAPPTGPKPQPEPVSPPPPEVKPQEKNNSSCPGNSCNAPGHQNQNNSNAAKPAKPPKS